MDVDEQGASSSSQASEETLTLSVKTLDNQQHSVVVSSNVTVLELKQILEEKTGIPQNRQRLIYKGKVLHDEKHLSQYDLQNGYVLHLVQRPDNAPARTPPEPVPNPNPNTNPTGNQNHGFLVSSINVDSTPEGLRNVGTMVQSMINSMMPAMANRATAHARQNPPTLTPDLTQELVHNRLNTVHQLVRRASQIHQRTSAAVAAVEHRSQSNNSDSGDSSSSPSNQPLQSAEIPTQPEATEPNLAETTQTGEPAQSGEPAQGESAPASNALGRTNIRDLAKVLRELNQLNIAIQPTLDRLQDAFEHDDQLTSATSRSHVQRLANSVARATQQISQAYGYLTPILRSVHFGTEPGSASIQPSGASLSVMNSQQTRLQVPIGGIAVQIVPNPNPTGTDNDEIQPENLAGIVESARQAAEFVARQATQGTASSQPAENPMINVLQNFTSTSSNPDASAQLISQFMQALRPQPPTTTTTTTTSTTTQTQTATQPMESTTLSSEPSEATSTLAVDDALDELPAHSADNIAEESWHSLIPEVERAIWVQTIAEDRARLQQTRLANHFTDLYELTSPDSDRRRARQVQMNYTLHPESIFESMLTSAANRAGVALPNALFRTSQAEQLNQQLQERLRQDAQNRLNRSQS